MNRSETGGNVLVVGALAEATGNAAIATCIAKHIETRHRVVLVDSNTTAAPALRAIVEDNNLTVAVGLHALLAGPFVRATEPPYALVFGGTDLYAPSLELQHVVGDETRFFAAPGARFPVPIRWSTGSLRLGARRSDRNRHLRWTGRARPPERSRAWCSVVRSDRAARS